MTVAEKLVALLKAQGLTCATAESCMGGGVGSAITAVPGSSAVFAGGVISYANEVKRDVLGVSDHNLQTVGAVSSEVADNEVGIAAETTSEVDGGGIAGDDTFGRDEKPPGFAALSREIPRRQYDRPVPHGPGFG